MRLEKTITKLNKKYEDREIIFAAAYGSHNYGTNDETSDYDYKLFVMPNVEDLYKGKMFSSTVKLEGDDYEVHDIRKVVSLWIKSNPTYLEILSSKEVWINPKYKEEVQYFFDNRERIAQINLKGLYDATMGMAKQKAYAIQKDLPNSDNNEGFKRKMKFGFDSKQLLHTTRLIAMRNEVFLNGTNLMDVYDLRGEFPEGSYLKGLLPELKDIKKNVNGLTKETALEQAFSLLTDIKEKIGYTNFKEDEEAKAMLNEHVFKTVINELTSPIKNVYIIIKNGTEIITTFAVKEHAEQMVFLLDGTIGEENNKFEIKEMEVR